MRAWSIACATFTAASALVGCDPPRRAADPPPPHPVVFVAPSNIAAVSLSTGDLCVKLSNGGVLCRRDFRPRDELTRPASFVPVFTEGDVQEVELGADHGCVRRLGGVVQCWGENEHGEVSGDELLVPWPQVVALPGPAAQVSLGSERTCALLVGAPGAGGRVSCWGTFLGVRQPPKVLPVLADVVELRLSGHALCLRTSDGTVRCGYGDSPLFAVAGLAAPQQLVVGAEHACARLAGGRVACWTVRAQDFAPDKGALFARTVELTDVEQLASGDAHVCARRGDRRVVCWGGNDYGELGDGTRSSRAAPAPVARLTDVVDVVAGGHRSCARRQGGGVLCWGQNLLDDAMFHALTGLQSPSGPPSEDDSLIAEPLRVPGALQDL